MSGFLDIYTKLIIAIISFIAPLIVHLISVIEEGPAVIKKEQDEFRFQRDKLERSMNEQGFDSKTVKASSKNLKKQEGDYSRLSVLLEPKVQSRKIFITLFLSLVLTMFYKLIDDCTIPLTIQWIKTVTVYLSILLFFIGIYFLKTAAWAAFKVKRMISEKKNAVIVQQ